MLRARVCFQAGILCLALTTTIFAQTPRVTALGNDTLSFEEAGGQVGSGQAAFTSSVSGLSFKFYENQAAIVVTPQGASAATPIHLTLSGASRTPQLSPEGLLPGIVNYFPSSDQRTWRTNLRTWSGLRYKGIYPGVDLVYYGNRGQLEYDFVVAPQHDPKNIALEIGSAQQVSIAQDGGLSISGSGVSLRFSKPVIYQLAADGSHEPVAGRYVMQGADRIAFDIPNWDRKRALVIDPNLVWSSYEGINGDTYYAGTIDSSGNVYMTGRSAGVLLVEKLSSNGVTLVYRDVVTATPSYSVTPQDIRVDSAGNAVIVGSAGVNFPTTTNAFLQSVTSGTHAIVAVLNAAGTAITYATYLAGTTSAGDQANGVAIDSSNKIYVTGLTDSITFPTTTGVFQTKNASGQQVAFVSKIDPTKSGAASLVYSTYLSGPTTQSTGNAIAVDGSGNAYVTGNAGGDFPVTAGSFAYDGASLGQGGVYVTKLNPTATALTYSAYLGPGTATGIGVDTTGDAYVAGAIGSGTFDFPTTTGAYQIIYPAGFATEVNPAGTALVYSTFLSGPSENITVTDLAIEPGCVSACGAFIVGYSGADDLPLTNPIQNFNASFANGFTGGNDAFVTALNGTGTAAVYSTYIGGSSDESSAGTTHSPAIAANATGEAFVVGPTSSSDFPVTLTTTAQRSTYALRIGATAGATGVMFPATLAFSTQQPVGAASNPPLIANLRNMGSSAMTVTSITPSPSDYTQTNTCGTSLVAGAECAITVTFTPTTAAARPGTLTIVQSGAGSPNVINLTGSGVNQPLLTISPTTLTFADQSVGTASPAQSVTLTNVATTSLTLGTTPFTISADYAQTNNCPATLAKGASCTVNISFLPTQSGVFAGSLQVSSNTSSFGISTVNMSGTGFIGTPALTLSSAGLVFNPQVIGIPSAFQSVSVSNTGNVPVTIYGVSVTGDYAVTGCIQTLNPGGACSVRVNFTPTATGTRAGKVTLADSTAAGTHSFTTTGTGLAQTSTLSFDPASLIFADLAVGATSSPALTLQVTNTSDAPVLISRVYPTGDFRISSTSCVVNLRVGSTCNIGVEFTPTATGARKGTIILEDAATGSPQSINLSGNGLVAAPAAIASPDSYNFGPQAIGSTSVSEPSINLTNIGNLPFDASNVTLTPSPSDFSIVSQGCFEDLLVPGRSCGVAVTFTPTATGTRTASLTFTNAAGVQNATLNGTGVTASLALGFTPASLTFQPQQRGVASPSQVLWVRNTGSAPVNVTSIVPGSTDYTVGGCGIIQPNTSCQTAVTFTPSVTTTDNSTLTVNSNATGSPQVINLTGSGATALPAMQLLPAGLGFNTQVVATASSGQSVQVMNNSTSTVTSIAITLAGADPGDFAIGSNSCTTSLAAATQCGFQVTFKPTVAGARTASINIVDSAGTQTVLLSGFAVTSSTSALLPDSALFFPSETIGFTSPAQQIPFENTGNSPFTISSVVLGGTNPGDFNMSSSCPISPTLFNGSASCNTSVSFTPTAAGTRTATVTITYTGAAGSPAVVTLSGKGVAATTALEVGPTSITFPPQVNTTLSPVSPTVLLTNTGTGPVTISSIVLGGAQAGDFSISNGCPIGTLQQGPLSNTCGVGVGFTPTATGARKATITITDNAPGSPTTINLSGTGVAPTKTLVVTPTTLVFDPQVTGTTSTQQFITVNNTGNFTVAFTNVTITTGFALSNGCVGSLPPLSACSIGVTFTPTAAGKTTGTVTITDNATGSPQKVTLTGTGISTSQQIELSQTAVVFDAQTVSTASSPQTVYYSNQGNTTVTINTVTQTDTEFSLSGSSCVAGTQVSPQSLCTFRITFTPSATGTRSSTLTIADTATGSPRKITLSGVGISSAVPEVNLTPASLTFATQAEGTTSAAQNINLTNNGQANLTISNIAIAGADPSDFAETNTCTSPLVAGFSCNISVTFSPIATGSRTATVTVTDNATGSPQSVTLTGTGKAGALPTVTLTPPSLSFPSIPVNTGNTQTVTVKNTGAAALNISNIAISGTVTSDFSQTNTCSGSIAVSGTCAIMVTFTPSTIENQTGTVTITDNAANSPQSVPITGNGAEAAVDTSPSALMFSSQKVGTTSPAQIITVENYGDATLTISGVSVTGPFAISANTCGSSLAAGLSCSISIQFKPTATGAANGDLILNDNAGDSPQFVALSGTGS
jgi:Beta-propeller repeat/Abnormal spindle-like microcephaly-assoc'd, ASPM-SPD-2-Hydin